MFFQSGSFLFFSFLFSLVVVIADVSGQATHLAQLQEKQEEIFKKLQAEIDKKVEEFKKAAYEIVRAANERFKEESLKYIEESYQGLTPEAKESLARIWVEGLPTVKEADIQAIVVRASCSFFDFFFFLFCFLF